MVGVATTATGVEVAEAAEKAPTPTALRARTLNRYVAPLVSPVMVWVVADEAKLRDGCA